MGRKLQRGSTLMLQGFDYATILLGIVIFLARVTDVSMGTMRTISIVQGRTKIAFLLGFVEVSMWLVIISTVIHRIAEQAHSRCFLRPGFFHRQRGRHHSRKENRLRAYHLADHQHGERERNGRENPGIRTRGDHLSGGGFIRAGHDALRGVPEEGTKRYCAEL